MSTQIGGRVLRDSEFHCKLLLPISTSDRRVGLLSERLEPRFESEVEIVSGEEGEAVELRMEMNCLVRSRVAIVCGVKGV